MRNKTLIVIQGPTAIGKTALALKIAAKFGTEIVSADSRQFYREMHIGTAKPSSLELNSIRHHFINSHSVEETFTVADFEKAALDTIESIFKDQDHAILVGGSGLYIKAVTEGFDYIPEADPNVRRALNTSLLTDGIGPLQKELKMRDPVYYNQVDLSNPQRIIRALEVCISSGMPYSSFRVKNSNFRPFKIKKIGLDLPRNILYQRINERVDQMIQLGLYNEVISLEPYWSLNALNTVGYREFIEAIENKNAIEEAIDHIKQNTRRFAKRQLTWFRKDQEIKWFEPDEYNEILAYLEYDKL